MRVFIAIFLVFFIGKVSAQTYEVGVFAGGANNIGDVGRTTFVLPSGAAYGALFKWNKSKRYAWRAGVTRASFTADDAKSNITSRQQRGYRIKNSLLEVSAGLEVNFVEYNLHKLGPAYTPYLYTGATYFRYDFNYFDGGELQDYGQRDGAFSIPMVVGFKARVSQFIILGAEVGARYTFTDNLDGSFPKGSNVEGFQFGNIFSEDWYVFSGVTVTYTFGRKLCKDCFE
ncbi:MAG: DUF6089 family protein [Cellulophaga sp.]